MHTGHTWSAAVAVGVVAIVVQTSLPLGTVSDVGYVAIGALAVVAVLVAVRRRALPRRGAWALLGVGLACSVAGDLVWTVYEHRGLDPFPSLADVFYLGGYPLLGAGLWRLAERPAADRGSLTDTVIIGVSAAVLGWVHLLLPFAEDVTLTTVERLVSLAYPVGDLMIVPLIARLVFIHAGRVRAHLLLFGAVGSYLVADILFTVGTMAGWYVTGGPIDALWLVAYVAVAAAVWHPSAGDELSVPSAVVALSGRRLAALATASVLAPVTVLLHAGDGHIGRVGATASIVLFLLVVHRMAGLIGRIHEQSDELEVLATTDPLTGAANRRHLERRLTEEVARAERAGTDLAVAMLDLDHFKAYNDEHGHPAGDRFLQGTVTGWRDELRDVDLLARYGGEEFVVVLPGCDVAAAMAIVDRLRTALLDARTCSAGITVWVPGASVDDLVGQADQALYLAKRTGRDRSLLHEHPQPSPV